MKYDLIVSDFDGTFRHGDTSVGQKNLSAVQQFTARGGIFSVCTGRMPSSIRPILLSLDMGGLFAAYQGSVVGEVQSGKLLRESGFSKEEALFICEEMQKMNLRIHAYDRENCYVNYEDGALYRYEEICRIRSVRDDDLYGRIEKSDGKFFKLLAMVNREERNDVRDELRQRLGKDFYISCSASTLVEVTAVRDTKAVAVNFLCEYYKIPRERTLAFGDNQNDAPLLQAAGRGVAVANADEYLKGVADETTEKTCDEDAVGDYMEKYVLSV